VTSSGLDFAADHFSLFGLPSRQGLDAAELDARFRELQAQVHPDKYAHAGDADQRLSMQWATRVNEAYQTLKSPLKRARYLLQLRGHDARIESNTAMPMDFLIAQMELRESVEAAKVGADDAALEATRRALLAEIRQEHARLQQLIDVDGDFQSATELVRQLMFKDKLLEDIDDALEAVLS
jgi:molecular chaperone HscB